MSVERASGETDSVVRLKVVEQPFDGYWRGARHVMKGNPVALHDIVAVCLKDVCRALMSHELTLVLLLLKASVGCGGSGSLIRWLKNSLRNGVMVVRILLLLLLLLLLMEMVRKGGRLEGSAFGFLLLVLIWLE